MFANSVVQITSTSASVDPTEPWKSNQKKSTSTGFIIDHDGRKHIVTNAHCVENTTCLTIKFSSGKLYDANIKRINNECDLALLEVSERDPKKYEEFQKNAVSFVISDENLEQGIRIESHGFTHGQGYFHMKGELGRMEVGVYVQSGVSFLTYGTTCPTRPGNSGGPIIYEGKVIGVTHQGEANNGPTHAIPACILRRFLNYPDGFPELSVRIQTMECPLMRKACKMNDDMEGILVVSINPFSSAKNILEIDDVLLEIDGFKINNEGKIQHPVSKAPIFFTHAVYMHRLNETVNLKIFRDNKELDVQIPLTQKTGKNDVVAMKRDERQLDYCHFHGLIIAPLTRNYINFVKNDNKFSSLSNRTADAICMFPSAKSEERKKLFVILKLLESNLHGLHSYPDYTGYVIKKINGIEIDSFRTLVDAFNKDVELHRIELNIGTIFILPNLTTVEEQALLQKYQIAQGKCSERIKRKLEAYMEEKLEKIMERAMSEITKDPNNKELDEDKETKATTIRPF